MQAPENHEKHKHRHPHKHPASPEHQEPAEPGKDDDPAVLRLERDDLLARLQRVSADFMNYQKRVQKDIAHTQEFANEELIKALLVVVDDMDRALHAVNQHRAEDDPLRRGMELVHQKTIQTLKMFGLNIMQAEGTAFDPEKHAAIIQQPSSDHPPMTVIKELEKGYQLKGRTIRPAKVIVSTAPDQQGQPQPQEGSPDRNEPDKKNDAEPAP